MTQHLQVVIASTAIATIRDGGIRQRFAKPPPPPQPGQLPVKKPLKKNKNTFIDQISQLWFGKVPEIGRYFVSGNLGNLCFFLLEKAVHDLLCQLSSPSPFVEDYKDTIAFFVAYMLQIITQHLLHAWLVYGLHTINSQEKYFSTLLGQAGAYVTAMFGSTMLNAVLRKWGMAKTPAFITTLYVFALINYFVIGWIVRRSVQIANIHEKERANNSKTKGSIIKDLRGGGGVEATTEVSFWPRGIYPLFLVSHDDNICADFVRSTCQPVQLTQNEYWQAQ